MSPSSSSSLSGYIYSQTVRQRKEEEDRDAVLDEHEHSLMDIWEQRAELGLKAGTHWKRIYNS